MLDLTAGFGGLIWLIASKNVIAGMHVTIRIIKLPLHVSCVVDKSVFSRLSVRHKYTLFFIRTSMSVD